MNSADDLNRLDAILCHIQEVQLGEVDVGYFPDDGLMEVEFDSKAGSLPFSNEGT